MADPNRVDCVTERPNEYAARITVRAHELRGDAREADGGHDEAPDPHDYFDTSLASCKALTAIWYAKRHNIALERVEAHVERDASEERKGRYRLTVRLVYHGALSDADRQRLHVAVQSCPISKLMTTSEIVIETAPLDASAAGVTSA
jgi:putative redox protein